MTYRDCPECCGRGCVPSDASWQLVPCEMCKGTGRIAEPAGLPVAMSINAATASCSIYVGGVPPFGRVYSIYNSPQLPAVYLN
jgi:hypothetical protein